MIRVLQRVHGSFDTMILGKAQQLPIREKRDTSFPMPVFSKAAGPGAVKASVGGGGSGSGSRNGCPLMSLKDVASCVREPVNYIGTIGRIACVYATSEKYPNVKFILTGEGQDNGIVKVLVKGAGKPPKMPEIDQLIRLDSVEVRRIHRKASGEIPLSANFGSGAGAKRKRNQWLG